MKTIPFSLFKNHCNYKFGKNCDYDNSDEYYKQCSESLCPIIGGNFQTVENKGSTLPKKTSCKHEFYFCYEGEHVCCKLCKEVYDING